MPADLLNGRDQAGRRPEIELAWHRASISGLDPGMGVRETARADVETRSALTVAAEPVLDGMVDDLADTRFSILIADRDSRIVDRRVANRTMEGALDRVLAIPGFQYLEEVSGTNSLATAFELRRPIAVGGEEHFLEALRGFCCYGAPIIHPITRRLEGVLDVTGPVSDATGLLGPFLMRAARDIEERLLERARVAEKRLLAEFQIHAGQRRHAVVALGDNLVLSNPPAVDLVKAADHAALRAIAADLTGQDSMVCALTLVSGTQVTIRARLVAGSIGGALFEIIEGPTRSPARVRLSRNVEPVTPTKTPSAAELARTILVTGEPGTGRTTTAVAIGGSDARVHDAADSIGHETEWFLSVRAALTGNSGAVLIENIDALSSWLANRLAAPIRVSRRRVVLTGPPPAELNSAQSALASLALTRHELQPLRTCKHNLARIIDSLLSEIAPGSDLDVSLSALTYLAAQLWPGNLRELRSVLEHAVRGRTIGTIIDADLPEAIRAHPPATRKLTVMETAERDTIVAALRDADGNKTAAAEKLGIGRTTLYVRLRQYRIAQC